MKITRSPLFISEISNTVPALVAGDGDVVGDLGVSLSFLDVSAGGPRDCGRAAALMSKQRVGVDIVVPRKIRLGHTQQLYSDAARWIMRPSYWCRNLQLEKI